MKDTGKYYGYPDCCVDGFSFSTKNQRTKHQNDFDVHKGYGFIPCAKHAKQVAEGKIELKDLITNRECPYPFPIDEMDVEKKPFHAVRIKTK